MAKLNISEHFCCDNCARASSTSCNCTTDFIYANPKAPYSCPYTCDDYLDTFDVISPSSEAYFRDTYGAEYHSLSVWEQIMDYEYPRHPEWAKEEKQLIKALEE